MKPILKEVICMVKIIIDEVNYKLCEKCGVYKAPVLFRVKGKKRKACSTCRTKKQ
jgi:hypothetical protein